MNVVWFTAIVLMLAIPSLIMLSAYAGSYIAPYYRLRNKGYTPPESFTINVAGFMIGLFFSGVCFAFGKHHLFIGEDLLFHICLWLVVLPVINFLFSSLFPAGRKGFSIRWLAGLLVAVIVAIVMLYVYVFTEHGLSREAIVKGAIDISIGVAAVVYAYFSVRARFRERQRLENEVKVQPGNKYILLIRPFAIDRDPFFLGNIYKNKVYKQLAGDATYFMQDGAIRVVDFKQFFSKAFNNYICAVMPEHTLTQAEVVICSPAKTPQQIEDFKILAGGAACIIAIPGNIGKLSLELQMIRENGWQEKFFIFTKPIYQKLYAQILLPLFQWVLDVKPVQWDQFAARMKQSGYMVQEMAPEPGTIHGL
ncbi:hypothetical protein MKQ70_09265 [Chitinophaga sedimenti]|uniref:hypothetical protein n=1 Tax=Chitinophaga sedimenti TaxID=2033606 RepID=UPI00200570BC|nr:hypothetical protein [Chitinophaga sedimenti]MCK7555184.1 hypothetical protein [Chitinophaga sedimenti]